VYWNTGYQDAWQPWKKLDNRLTSLYRGLADQCPIFFASVDNASHATGPKDPERLKWVEGDTTRWEAWESYWLATRRKALAGAQPPCEASTPVYPVKPAWMTEGSYENGQKDRRICHRDMVLATLGAANGLTLRFGGDEPPAGLDESLPFRVVMVHAPSSRVMNLTDTVRYDTIKLALLRAYECGHDNWLITGDFNTDKESLGIRALGGRAGPRICS